MNAVPGYTTRKLAVAVGGHEYRLRVLADRQQYADPDGHSRRLGISSAQWSLFGMLWPTGQVLAQAMAEADIDGKRILELGCGIGLASLVLQRRGADIVATDIHPLAEPFLAYNSALNGLASVHYRHLGWDQPLPSLGRFDLIIAADVLYEPGQAAALAGVIQRHGNDGVEVMLSDPGRGHTGAFTRQLALQELVIGAQHQHEVTDEHGQVHRARILHYRRSLPDAA